MRLNWVGLAAVSLLGVAPQARAAATTYVLDQDRTTLHFTGRAMGHRFTGTARAVQATLVFYPERAGLAQPAEILVQVAAMETGNAARDRDMRAMFDADRYPTIRCVVTKIELLTPTPAETTRYRLEGRLRIRSIERPFSVEAAASVSPDGIEASGRVPLSLADFDLAPPRLMLGLVRVHSNVRVTFTSRWTRQP